MTDDIALIGREYLKAKPGKDEPEVVTSDDLKEAYNGINDLLWAFHWEGEASDGIIREEVPKRKDIPVSKSVKDGNAHIRAELAKVHLGSELSSRHRKLLERLHSAHDGPERIARLLTTRMASNESPPRAKKLLCTLTCSRPRTSPQMAASAVLVRCAAPHAPYPGRPRLAAARAEPAGRVSR